MKTQSHVIRLGAVSTLTFAVIAASGAACAASPTTAAAPADGVYRFTFGVNATQDGSFAVPAGAVYDAQGAYDAAATFTYGFLGTTESSYRDDVPASPSCAEPSAIDGFQVIEGQRIVLHDAADLNGVPCVKGPAASEYLPTGASRHEGRYPIRFAMRGEERAYYAVTCTVANASSTANADVTLFSERQHIQAHHLALAPGETRTFVWSVELAPNVYKTQGTYYDNAINVCVVGTNAALAALTVVKQPQVPGTVRGEAVANMNVGRTMWLCTDSTGTDQKNATPYFSLQNYSGVGSGLSRYAPANLSIRNQGEGGLATSARAHRQSCLLKPGDYLYVEYGHNESSVESYTNNLEAYLADANTAGAYLVVVSPVERRTAWNGETATWGRSLQGIAEAGEAWVEDKIAQGARNVAFIDLNKRYNDWMNTELRRINAVNPSVSLNAAISYYYRSAKGANVDNTHINNAGTDQAAYWVWYDALARVVAGEAFGATESQIAQAAVLRGIADGYQDRLGLEGAAGSNMPWSVTDDIINDGPAPNTFWDTPVSAGFAYANDAVVADVAATANADGTVTISNVTMRILNPGNYYKAVIDVVSADGAATNRYWSYYNYDVGGAGKVSGDLVDPAQPGFLTADRDKADVSAADVASVTVPAGGKALVWIAEADAGTWQVGGNAPCSPKRPVEWWSDVLLDDDCASLGVWRVNTGAVHSETVVDGAIYFTTTGADSGNTKKNYGLCHALGSSMTYGRFRISFKAMMDSGNITFSLGDSIYSTTTMLFNNRETLVQIDGTSVTGYGATSPLVTVGAGGAPQNVVNKLRWLDVDMIIDRDYGKVLLSVGGSDYVEYADSTATPAEPFSGRAWKYFGITCPGQQSSYGYVDDVKVVRLRDDYLVTKWDFSSYSGASAVHATEATTVTENGMTFQLQSGDALTDNGLFWKNPATGTTSDRLSEAGDHYIVFTPTASGLLEVDFSVDAYNSSRKPTMVIKAAESASVCTNGTGDASVSVASANDKYTLSATLTGGVTYYIWTYSYNWSGGNFPHNYTISSMTYAQRPVAAVSDYVYTGLAGDGLWATPGNWTLEGTVPASAPSAGDNVVIDGDFTVVVTNGQNVGTLSLANGASLAGPGPYAVDVAEGVVALTRVPSSFVWTNTGTGNWETLANWTVNGHTTDVLPGGTDEVLFPASLGKDALVKYSTSQTVSNAVFDAEVTLRIVGTRHDYYLYANEISGDGKLILTNAAIGARGVVSGNTSYSTNLTVNVDVEMAPASTNRLFCAVGNIVMNGDMSGCGCVEASIYKQSFGPQFNGDNENFSGEYWTTVNTGARRDYTQFADGGATSSNASWRVIGSDGYKAFFAKNNETYYFGALNGTVDNSNGSGNGYVNGCWAEIGALNVDCAFGGHYSRGYGSSGKPNDPHINHIRKVGTAKLTLTLSRPVGDIEIMGGTLVIGSQNSVPLYHTDAYQHYLKFLGDGATLAVSGTVTENDVTNFIDPSARIGYSTHPICFSNAVSEVHTWSTALAASNTGGLVKKGEGTLTLAATPLYTGDTYLEGGTLKIPTSANIKVKTHVNGKSVWKKFETIDGTQYTVYTLGAKRMMVIVVK